LTETQRRLAAQLQEWQKVREQRQPTEQELAALRTRLDQVEERRLVLQKSAGIEDGAGSVALSIAELKERGRKLTAEIEALRNAPPVKQTLRYRTPISRPLQTEELLFELRRGRIAFIDIGTMLDEVRQIARDKGELLRTQWEVTDMTAPVGTF